MKYIYIAGYGRSGSTLLEMLLAERLNGICLGEVCGLFDRERNGEGVVCSCGSVVGSGCDCWDSVCRDVSQDFELPQTDLHRYLLEAEKIKPKKNRDVAQKYEAIWKNIFGRILEERHLYIDSSKTARGNTRLEYLDNILGKDLLVIHLVRNPGAVMFSRKRGKNTPGKLEKPPAFVRLRTVYGWWKANKYVREVKSGLVNGVVSVRYEDLVKDPESVVQNISKYCGEKVFKDGYPKDHAIAGNRTRKRGVSVIREDDEWKSGLGYLDKLLLKSLAKEKKYYSY